ncbi:hypothetical protein DM860_016656 [Cuscuta australis]|uniref:Galactose oxidase-like Early set domain-containing protein n=1 Tax=Cuscuta australis TaxID=267555 RepID=A0A328DQF1_9ASTE|nr:hypothetical protein DM860_016656 [Cuscuta australis]
MKPSELTLPFFTMILLMLLQASPGVPSSAATAAGKWDMLRSSIGISAMHMQLLHNDRVVIFDRTEFGRSNISLPDAKCAQMEAAAGNGERIDCTAHSVEYDVAANSVRPLMVLTDFWCSSGSVSPDGVLVQTGGNKSGELAVRIFAPCDDNKCDWREIRNGLLRPRWYATNHILPGGGQIIVGGRNEFNYEFYPPRSRQPYSLPFLKETRDAKNRENNLYPFVLLNVDGNLFIFANNISILLNYRNNTVVRTYPEIPTGDPRCYPSTGSAVLLPLKNLPDPATVSAEVLVCGGAKAAAYSNSKHGRFLTALNTCGRITISDPNPVWVMETMPVPRLMGDMVMLPNGKVLIINGASSGSAGWEQGRDPVFTPVLYRPENEIGSRFVLQTPSKRPRMYHSTAILLRDGRVLVGGNNPHDKYNFTTNLFPTDLSLEAFSPAYLDPGFADLRPRIISPAPFSKFGYGKPVTVQFTLTGPIEIDSVGVTMVAPSFATHSFSMNQRLLVLGSGYRVESVDAPGGNWYKMEVIMPGSGNLAPPGYYLLFVVHKDIPCEGIWVQIREQSY